MVVTIIFLAGDKEEALSNVSTWHDSISIQTSVKASNVFTPSAKGRKKHLETKAGTSLENVILSLCADVYIFFSSTTVEKVN